MLVTVVIPTFNRKATILRAVNSVLNQTYPEIEVIVIDDGSSDGTCDLIKDLIGINYFQIKNSGVSCARNVGIEKSRGEIIAFLDSDDEWNRSKVEQQVNYLKKHPNLNVVYTNETWIRNGNIVQKKSHQLKKAGYVFAECLESCFIGPSSVMIKKELFEKYGLFDEAYEVCEDYELWLRISLHEEIGYISDELVNKFGGHSDQLSMKFRAMDFFRVKALAKFLKEQILSENDEKLVKEMIKTKSRYLIQGFEKYARFDDLKELESILSMI